MRRQGLVALAVMAAVLRFAADSAPAHERLMPRPARAPALAEPRARIAPDYGKLPVSFEPNVGQASRNAKFVARGSTGALLTPTGVVLGRERVAIEFDGARATVRLTGEGELAGKSNYLWGDDPSRWRTNVATYA